MICAFLLSFHVYTYLKTEMKGIVLILDKHMPNYNFVVMLLEEKVEMDILRATHGL
jgi:hypothetical protein